MSQREELTTRIETFIREQGVFNAPYGILTRKHESGSYREITFGRARFLDATVRVYGPQYLMVKWQGRTSVESGARGGYVFKGPSAEQALYDYISGM
jgi:hypothetical protein